MSYQEIVDLIEQFKQNPNMINDDDYLEKIKDMITDFSNYNGEKGEYIENNENVIKEIICNSKFIDRYLNNDIILVSFLEFNLENLDEISPKYLNRILEFVKNCDLSYLGTQKNFFDFIEKHDRSLLSNFELGNIFSEINEEVLEQYGNISV